MLLLISSGKSVLLFCAPFCCHYYFIVLRIKLELDIASDESFVLLTSNLDGKDVSKVTQLTNPKLQDNIIRELSLFYFQLLKKILGYQSK